MKEVCRNNSTSDDDDEDRKTLIMQNQIKSNSNSSFAIEIDELSPPIRRRFNKKRYLIAILIPLIVVLVYFSVDFRNLFKNSSVWDVGLISSSSDQMRESELKALNLLQQQQEELIKLLNRVGSKNYVSNLSNSSDLEATRAQVYKQISLNKEIQKVILSKSRNLSELGIENGDLMYEGIKMCPKIDQKFGERRTIEWNPRSDKFLFAVCISGQMSNHLICLEKHMFFAAVLGRVLVIPNQRVDYDYSKVLDIEHINKCIGRKVVITFDEFYEMKKKDLRINRFICYFSQPQKCYMDDDHVDKLKTLGMSLPDLESPWVEDVKNPKKRTVQDVEGKFSSDDDVIAIGDVFFAVVDRDWMMQPRGPIAHKCSTLIEPSRLIMLSTQRFIQTFLGKHYAALHFRRHGWLKFCNAKNPSCFYSVPQSADCIRRVVEKANAPVIYLSTDAADSETGLLQSLIIVDGKPIPLVKRPSRNSAEKWDALLYRHGLDDDPQVEAMLDKTICAMSSVFIGSSGSTFTEDIMRLRKGRGSASICDEYLCQGELPNFIAEDE